MAFGVSAFFTFHFNLTYEELILPVLKQIKKDVKTLKKLIPRLKDTTSLQEDGILLTGQLLKDNLNRIEAFHQAELKRLELILDAGIIQKKYYSIITKKTYLPSSSELKKKNKPLPPAKHTFFCIKKSRKDTNQPKSSFKVFQSPTGKSFNFSIEHRKDKDYPSGGYASKVK